MILLEKRVTVTVITVTVNLPPKLELGAGKKRPQLAPACRPANERTNSNAEMPAGRARPIQHRVLLDWHRLRLV
jgi:hypothetical protein